MSTQLLISATTHQHYAALLRLTGRRSATGTVDSDVDADAGDSAADAVRDRGAVSLEQVLWFVAAGVSVAVVAGVIWAAIRDQAETDIVVPEAP